MKLSILNAHSNSEREQTIMNATTVQILLIIILILVIFDIVLNFVTVGG